MTEQTKASLTRTGFANELGPIYEMWGDAEGRTCVRGDLLDAGPAETARQLAAADALLEGLAMGAAEAVGDLAGCLITDARKLAGKGREIAKRHAEREAREEEK